MLTEATIYTPPSLVREAASFVGEPPKMPFTFGASIHEQQPTVETTASVTETEAADLSHVVFLPLVVEEAPVLDETLYQRLHVGSGDEIVGRNCGLIDFGCWHLVAYMPLGSECPLLMGIDEVESTYNGESIQSHREHLRGDEEFSVSEQIEVVEGGYTALVVNLHWAWAYEFGGGITGYPRGYDLTIWCAATAQSAQELLNEPTP